MPGRLPAHLECHCNCGSHTKGSCSRPHRAHLQIPLLLRVHPGAQMIDSIRFSFASVFQNLHKSRRIKLARRPQTRLALLGVSLPDTLDSVSILNRLILRMGGAIPVTAAKCRSPRDIDMDRSTSPDSFSHFHFFGFVRMLPEVFWLQISVIVASI